MKTPRSTHPTGARHLGRSTALLAIAVGSLLACTGEPEETGPPEAANPNTADSSSNEFGDRDLETMARIALRAMRSRDPAVADALVPTAKELDGVVRAEMDRQPEESRAESERAWKKNGGAQGARDSIQRRIHAAVVEAWRAAGQEFDLDTARFDRVEGPLAERPGPGGSTLAGWVLLVQTSEAVLRFGASETSRFASGWSPTEGWSYLGPDSVKGLRIGEWIERATAWERELDRLEDQVRTIAMEIEDLERGGFGEPTDEETATRYAELYEQILQVLKRTPPPEGVASLGREIAKLRGNAKRLGFVQRNELDRAEWALELVHSNMLAIEAELGRPLDHCFDFRSWLNERAGEGLSAEDAERVEDAERLASALKLEVVEPHWARKFGETTDPDERFEVIRQWTKLDWSQAAADSLALWSSDTQRPVAEREAVFERLLEFAGPTPAVHRVARGLSNKALLSLVRLRIGRLDRTVVELISELPEREQDIAWNEFLARSDESLPIESLWSATASDLVSSVRAGVRLLEQVNASIVDLELRGVSLASVAASLSESTQVPFVCVSNAATPLVQLEHRGEAPIPTLLRQLEAAGFALRTDRSRILVGTPLDLAAELERARRVPDTLPEAGQPPWKIDLLTWLREPDSEPFFSSETPAREYLIEDGWFGRGSMVLLPALAGMAQEPAGFTEERSRAWHLQQWLERYDGVAILRHHALVLGTRDEIETIRAADAASQTRRPPLDLPPGLPEFFVESDPFGISVAGDTLSEALDALVARAPTGLRVSEAIRARWSSILAPWIRLTGDAAKPWFLLVHVLESTGHEVQWRDGTVQITLVAEG